MIDYRKAIDATVTPLDDITRSRVWQRLESRAPAPASLPVPAPRRWAPFAAFAAGVAAAAVVALVVSHRRPEPLAPPNIIVRPGDVVLEPMRIELPARDDAPVLDQAPAPRVTRSPSTRERTGVRETAPSPRDALPVTPETMAQLYARAEAALARGAMAEAETLLERVADGPERLLADEALYDLARIAVRRGDPARARERLDRLVEKTTDANLRAAAEQLRARLSE